MFRTCTSKCVCVCVCVKYKRVCSQRRETVKEQDNRCNRIETSGKHRQRDLTAAVTCTRDESWNWQQILDGRARDQRNYVRKCRRQHDETDGEEYQHASLYNAYIREHYLTLWFLKCDLSERY